MCNEGVEVDPWQLYDVPDYLKTQKSGTLCSSLLCSLSLIGLLPKDK